MKYRDLNASPGKSLEEIVKGLKRTGVQGSTGAHGVKHMGLTGDSRWYRPDGSEYSVRDIDGDLADAQIRIDDALAAIQDAKVGLEQAQIERDEISAGLDTLETVTIPGAVADLEAADQAAQQELATLDGKLVSAQEDLTTAEGNITQLGQDLAAESDARQQLASDTQTTFTELDTRLDTFGDDPALAGLRQALADAQNAVDAAQQVASEANTAANAASQAALEAAGIAASKGRVIVSETEPTGEDRTPSNIWIKPVPDDPDTEVEEKAVTYVYLEASDEWQPTTSSELAQAAQNALDAREAAQQAQQRADTAIANAAAAQAAAEAAEATAQHAQQTADGKNTVTYSTAQPSGSGKTDGDIWWQYDNNSNIQGQWVWKASASQWISRPFRSEVIANLDVGKLTAGSLSTPDAVIEKLWADGIAAKSVTASQVTVSGANLVPNPYFDDGAYGWNPHLAGPGSTATSSDAAYPGHANGVSLAPYTSGNSTIYGPLLDYRSAYEAGRIAVTPGETYTITAWVKRTAGAVPSDRIDLRVYAYDGLTYGSLSNGSAGRMKASDFAPEVWTQIGGDYTVPAGKYAITPRFTLYPDADWTPDAAFWHIGHYSVVRKVGAVLIEDGAVSADKINAESVAGAVGEFVEAEVGNLKATQGTIGTAVIDKIWADGIAAKAITAGRLIVGDAGISEWEWVSADDWGDWSYYRATSGWSLASGTAEYTGLGTDDLDNRLMGSYHPSAPDEVWQISVDVENLDNYALALSVGGYRSSGGSYSSSIWPDGAERSLEGKGRKTFHVTVPFSGASSDEEGFSPVLYFRNSNKSGGRSVIVHSVRVMRRNPSGSVLIEDGAITTPKLTVTSDMSAAIVNAMSVNTKRLVVTEDAILNHATLIGQTVVDDINVQGKLIGTGGVFTGTVDFANINVTGTQIVNKLGANSIDASKISGGSFTGRTFTGGLFRMDNLEIPASPASNGGIAIDPANGMRSWDSTSGHELVAQIGAPGKQNFLGGQVSTSPLGQPGAILTPVSGGGGGIWFSEAGGIGVEEAAIYSKLDGHVHIRPRSGGAAGTVFMDGNTVFTDKVSAEANLTAGGRIIGYDGLGTGEYIRGGYGSADIRLRNDGSPQFACAAIYDRTYSSSANVYVTSFGTLGRATSSRRYKKNITNWSPDAERVLALQPRQWQHDDPEHNPEIDETWQVGFIAEEVDELGLKGLVDYAGDGAGGWRPESLRYDRFAAAQQVVLQKHEAEIKELRERIAVLEAQNGAS